METIVVTHAAEPEHHSRRRVAFIGQPSAGKTTTASCCGKREDIPIEEEPLDIPLPGFVGGTTATPPTDHPHHSPPVATRPGPSQGETCAR